MSTRRKAGAKELKEGEGASRHHHTAAVQHHVLLMWALSNFATWLPGLARDTAVQEQQTQETRETLGGSSLPVAALGASWSACVCSNPNISASHC